MHHLKRKMAIQLLQSVALLFLLSGCAKKYAWSEEFQLSTGEKVTSARTMALETRRAFSGEVVGTDLTESSISFTGGPATLTLPGKWSVPQLMPLLVEREGEEWVLVATLLTCADWKEFGQPPLPYVEYRFKQGTWARSPLSSRLIGRSSNLLTPITESPAAAYTVESKKPLLSYPMRPVEQRKIVSKWQSNC